MSCANFLSELDRLLEQPHGAVDLDAREAVVRGAARTAPCTRPSVRARRGASIVNRVPSRQPQHLVDDLLRRLPLDHAATRRAVRRARPGRRAGAGSRRSRSPCRRSSAGCGTCSSGRSRSPATAHRSSRRPACPSGRGTGARRTRATRRIVAAPRRRACRTRDVDFPEPDRPVMTTSRSRGSETVMSFRLCSRAPRMTISSAVKTDQPISEGRGILRTHVRILADRDDRLPA